MSPITEAEKDLKYALRFVQPLLSIVGAWPIPVASSKLRKWCLIFVSYFLQLMVLIPGLVYLFAKESNSRRQLKLLVPHMNGLGQLSKYTILLCKTSQFRKALNEIRNDWLTNIEKNRLMFRSKARIGHRVVLMIAMTMYSSGICYRTILPLSKGRIVLPNNTTIRVLPCPTYFVFFNEQASPYYEIIFVLQVLGGFANYTILCGTVGTFALLSLHICSLLRILSDKMTELTSESHLRDDVIHEKIVDIVEYQEKIKRFLKDVEEITPYLCFIAIVVDTCIVCIVGYCIIMEWENSDTMAITIYIVLQTTCIMTNFTMCYIGQLLINESNDVRNTSITLNWYRFPAKKARCLILMIIMSNYPVKLTAGKIFEISLVTFTDIMKTSVGYLNLLRTVL